MSTPTKPDCCEAMQRELAEDDGVRFADAKDLSEDAFDVGGVQLFHRWSSGGDVTATWIQTGNESGWYGTHYKAFTRIRFCPWCGTEIDGREKLEGRLA